VQRLCDEESEIFFNCSLVSKQRAGDIFSLRVGPLTRRCEVGGPPLHVGQEQRTGCGGGGGGASVFFLIIFYEWASMAFFRF
jgi:hypothetical protein